jgi:predicted glycosyltransferase
MALLNSHMTVWIDLDNTPHVPFFAPIIEELEAQGHSLLITARDCFQVCDLAKLLKVECKPVGRHFGKHKVLKVAGLCSRALQLAPAVRRVKPALAVSHGSRAQLLASAILGIPSMVIMDYEFARGLKWTRPQWIMAPEIISDAAIGFDSRRILRYPGIKEDVYVARFKPESGFRGQLGLTDADLVVTVRPPATEAHYHVSDSDVLFRAAIEQLSMHPEVKIVLLPRNNKQESAATKLWPALFQSRKIIVPPHAIDGLNLIWHSDLVISGGGTMNREAAAMHVPVYSVFRGPIGAVDRYLAKTGRLVLLENTDDIQTKLVVTRRHRSAAEDIGTRGALDKIVGQIGALMESKCTQVTQAL